MARFTFNNDNVGPRPDLGQGTRVLECPNVVLEDDPISIVIPLRMTDSAEITVRSLATQTFPYFKIVLSFDFGKGAPWARNRGFRFARVPFVLFSDNDVFWFSNSLERMYNTLLSNPCAAYTYGSWIADGVLHPSKPFDFEEIKKQNYIPTMALIRSETFLGFSEVRQAFQDWDLWLRMAVFGNCGVLCEGGPLYSTIRDYCGITAGKKPEDYEHFRAFAGRFGEGT